MRAPKAGLIFVVIAAIPGFAAAQETAPPSSSPSTAIETLSLGPLAKSLILPGWGQFSEGRVLEGAFFLAGEAFCLIQVLLDNHRGNENYSLYQASMSPADAVRYRGLTERYDRRRNQFLLAGAAVWALNLLDIYLIVQNKDRPAAAWSVRIGCDDHQAFVVVAGRRF